MCFFFGWSSQYNTPLLFPADSLPILTQNVNIYIFLIVCSIVNKSDVSYARSVHTHNMMSMSNVYFVFFFSVLAVRRANSHISDRQVQTSSVQCSYLHTAATVADRHRSLIAPGIRT